MLLIPRESQGQLETLAGGVDLGGEDARDQEASR